ncbi:MAG: phosphonate ABC transporter, permease protein PhnE [Proteobacteria bacterium]|nr:phosphonate ABC transporter, permease protein PhnE [Burkholderiales bacterium]
MTSVANPASVAPAAPSAPIERWLARPPYGLKSGLVLLVVLIALGWSAQRVQIDVMIHQLGEAVGAQLGLAPQSQVGRGIARVGEAMFPPVISERTELARIEDLDRERLPWLARIEREQTREARLDPRTLQMEETVSEREVLVEPFGYATRVAAKMLETLEIAFWATLLAVLLSAPLAYFGAANYAPNRFAYGTARGAVSLLRAIPELISALFLVLAFGFGPVAGILALGLHAAGFLGKFYAEDIENADRKPQEALAALGASKLKVIWTAVLPQVLPQYVAYTMYVLDRNVRMATVIGIVGAGGIGQELKGRYDLFNYGHVTTILIAIFLTVFALDQVSARLRRRLL